MALPHQCLEVRFLGAVDGVGNGFCDGDTAGLITRIIAGGNGWLTNGVSDIYWVKPWPLS